MRVLQIALMVSTVLATAACQSQPPVPQQNAADLAWLDSLALYPPTPRADSLAVASPAELNLVAAETKAAPERTAARSTRSTPRRSS
jgi:hypothetical protein